MSSPSHVDPGTDIDRIRIVLPAQAEYARVVRNAIGGLGSRLGYSYEEVEELRTAVGEISNVLVDEHGSTVEWHVVLHPDALEIHAARVPANGPVSLPALSSGMLDGAVDEVEVDAIDARVRVLKRRRS